MLECTWVDLRGTVVSDDEYGIELTITVFMISMPSVNLPIQLEP